MNNNPSKPFRLIIALFVVSILLIYFIFFKPKIHRFSGATMGTKYNITYESVWWQANKSTVMHTLHNAVSDVDQRMSTYKYDSELMQFNRYPVGKPFKVSKDIIELVQQAKKISELSKGVYDITIGPLVNLWGFGPSIEQLTNSKVNNNTNADKSIINMISNYKKPTQQEIDQALARVGYTFLKIDPINLTLTKTKDIFVDLSSIAKGYGVDQAGRALESLGIKNYSVEIGGEIRVRGKNPNGNQWTIAVLGPTLNPQYASAIVQLTAESLASSGDYLNFFEVDGVRYSHVIDTKLGYPKTSDIAEVTVIAENTYYADALSTMFMMIGDKTGIELANKNNIAVYFVKYTKDSTTDFEIIYSKAFAPYLQKIKEN